MACACQGCLQRGEHLLATFASLLSSPIDKHKRKLEQHGTALFKFKYIYSKIYTHINTVYCDCTRLRTHSPVACVMIDTAFCSNRAFILGCHQWPSCYDNTVTQYFKLLPILTLFVLCISLFILPFPWNGISLPPLAWFSCLAGRGWACNTAASSSLNAQLDQRGMPSHRRQARLQKSIPKSLQVGPENERPERRLHRAQEKGRLHTLNQTSSCSTCFTPRFVWQVVL